MIKVAVKGSRRNSDILVGEKLENLSTYIPQNNVVIITDENVSEYYAGQFPNVDTITIGTGESVKTLDTAADIYQQLLEKDAQRSTFLVGIGGGIVCDITGFIASTFLRGINFGFVSSTLLSQVDASVGGKNGVNHKGYKNMIGVFNQPKFVICDNNLLKTLPERELLSGFAEIIKHAAIESSDYFTYLEENCDAALAITPEVIEKIIYDSVIIKSTIVNRDETEKGERRKLNFGHTFGHAIEKTIKMPHGEAVSLGMVLAASLSVKKGLLSQQKADRITKLLRDYKLPVEINFDRNIILEALNKDKKRKGDDIHFVLLTDIGDSVVQKISINELQTIIHEL